MFSKFIFNSFVLIKTICIILLWDGSWGWTLRLLFVGESESNFILVGLQLPVSFKSLPLWKMVFPRVKKVNCQFSQPICSQLVCWWKELLLVGRVYLKEDNQGVGEFFTAIYFNFLLQLLYNKLSGEKQPFIIFTVSVVWVYRQGPVGIACLCCVMFGALLSWKAQTDWDWNHLKACSPSCLAIDAARRLRPLQDLLPEYLHVLSSCSPRLYVTLWLGSKGADPQRESQVEASCILHLVSKVLASLRPWNSLGSHRLLLWWKGREYRPHLSGRNVIPTVRRGWDKYIGVAILEKVCHFPFFL